ncbi:Lrp/AsnC family transcriptional regulator, partial [Methylobacterium nigriterrae]|uniref:Lrp/AsnC family transcriptional regulator n=1 Tax=Methylobacterium nigriterrae TaxID=3127512 RepID=UPI0030141770
MQERRIDVIDRKILAELQRDGRVTIQDLAGRVGLSASPCLRRIRMLEDAGILKGYVALVDQATVGLPISVFASVKLERQR